MNKVCEGCGKSLEGKRSNTLYCTNKCREAKYHSRVVELNGKSPYGTAVTGVVSELVVALDLLKKGYAVFRSVSANAPCDLAIVKNKHLLLIEVTTGRKSFSGKLIYPKHKKYAHIFDIIAVVEKGTFITYIPELPPV